MKVFSQLTALRARHYTTRPLIESIGILVHRRKTMKQRMLWIAIVSVCMGISLGLSYFSGAARAGNDEPTRLAVVWTSGDADVAHKTVFMYVYNAQKRGWYDQTLLIVWGPSSRLLAGDKELQAKVKDMINEGVMIQACKACADMYGVSPALSELGIEVKYMGEPLSRILQNDGWDTMTF